VGDHGYGALGAARPTKPDRPSDDPGEENPLDSPSVDAGDAKSRPEETPTTTRSDEEQPPEDQQAG
jgi:hypothetical protein